ncbi:hypothetical protein OY671_011803, partial [Metschnikowia pulcherrima]
LASVAIKRTEGLETFVTRAQFRRVLQVFVPTLSFCVAMQWLGLYVASFSSIAGFMAVIGKITWWKSLLTAFVFVAIMFVTTGDRIMEALGSLFHGFAVLFTWKILASMMVGSVLGIFVGVSPGLGGPNGVAISSP